MKKRVAIYSPVSLWKDHHPQVVELAWREFSEGSSVTVIFCDKAFSGCPANRFNEPQLCTDCTKQSKYTTKRLLPPNTKQVWFRKSKTKSKIMNPVNDLEELKNQSLDGFPIGVGVASYLVSKYQDIFVPQSIVQIEGSELLQQAIEFYEFSKNVLSDQIDQLYVWGGRRHTEAPIIFAADRFEIPVKSFEIGEGKRGKIHVSSSRPFTLKGLREDYNLWLNRVSEIGGKEHLKGQGREFLKRSINGELSRIDMPYFMRDAIPNHSKIRHLESDPKKKITFFTSSLWEYVMYSDWDAYSDFGNLYEFVAKFCLDKKFQENKIIIRWHPNLVNAGSGELSRMKQVVKSLPHVLHILPNEKVNSYELVELSNIVITPGSTIGLEAALMGKRVITVGNTTYSNLKFSHVAEDYTSLTQLLQRELPILDPEDAFLYAAYMENKGEDFRFVHWENNHYELQGKKIEYKSALRKIREIRYKFLATLKYKLEDMGSKINIV
jgi:Capsule polysaccharide biosynthesis protein